MSPSPPGPAPTRLAYFEDTYLTSIATKVQSVERLDPPAGADAPALPTYAIVLDATVAYPAGGGQPSDTGRIVPSPSDDAGSSSSSAFVVREARMLRDGRVEHVGEFLEEGAAPLQPGAEVTVAIDADMRLLHARVHSAGHLLDVAMTAVGFGPKILAPAKGLHGADQAYVEYAGKVEGLDKEKLMEDLRREMRALVARGGASAAEEMAYADAARACGGELPPYVSADATPRVVTILPDTEGCPCGGTHVRDVAEIGDCDVVGVRVKKGVTRVSYTIEGMKDHAKRA